MPGFQNKAGIGSVPNTFDGMPVVRSGNDGNMPYFQKVISIGGITKDSTGAALAGCTVHLFKSLEPREWAGTTVSLADGSFSFNVDPGVQYFTVAYLPGGTPVAGTTVQSLVGA